MAPKTLKLKRLAAKGYNVHVPRWTEEQWAELVRADPAIPRSVRQLRELVRTNFRREIRPKEELRPMLPEGLRRGIIRRRIEECGETQRWRLFAALGNPQFTAKHIEAIDADIDQDGPTFDQSLETTHFILRWTNSSPTPSDNIADASIISETGDFLEQAWTRYNTAFGRAPYVSPGQTKIEVVFWDIGGYGVTTPGGPIELDAPNWISQPGIRRPTSCHELFHRMQYAFGFRTTWTPSGAFQWFSEGTASWAEVFMWQAVSRAEKITDLFTNPDLNLYNASYSSLPFWIFFDTRQRDTPDDLPMLGFLQKYEASGNAMQSLAQAIDEDWPPNNVYGQLDTFFSLFARDRHIGAWRVTPSGPTPYPTIDGPTGAAINPVLALTAASLGSGDTYSVSGSVSQLGSDYYRLSYEADAGGETLNLNVTVPVGGDYSYYLIWEKAGAWVRAVFPFQTSAGYSYSEAIDLNAADALVVVISGRGNGGAYTLSATIT
jgi:hypothetical protein